MRIVIISEGRDTSTKKVFEWIKNISDLEVSVYNECQYNFVEDIFPLKIGEQPDCVFWLRRGGFMQGLKSDSPLYLGERIGIEEYLDYYYT